MSFFLCIIFFQPWLLYSITEFGSALNIETLVAAAERRETPIEVIYYNLTVFHKTLDWTIVQAENMCQYVIKSEF